MIASEKKEFITAHLPLASKPCLVTCEQCGLVSDLNDNLPYVLLAGDDETDFEKVPYCPNCKTLLC